MVLRSWRWGLLALLFFASSACCCFFTALVCILLQYNGCSQTCPAYEAFPLWTVNGTPSPAGCQVPWTFCPLDSLSTAAFLVADPSPAHDVMLPLWQAARFPFWKALPLFLSGASSGYSCLLSFVGSCASLFERRIFIIQHSQATFAFLANT